MLLALLGSPNLSSRRSVYEQYDHNVQANTVAGPGRGAAVAPDQGHDARRSSPRPTPTPRSARSTRGSARRCPSPRPPATCRSPARGRWRHQLPQLRRPDPARGVLAAQRGGPRPVRRLPRARPAGHRRQRLAVQRVARVGDRADPGDRRRGAARRRRQARRAGVPRRGQRGAAGRRGRAPASRAASTRGSPAPRPRTARRALDLAREARRPGVHPRGDRPRPRRELPGRVGRRPRGRARRDGDLGRARGERAAARRRLAGGRRCSARARRGSSCEVAPRHVPAFILLARQHGLPGDELGHHRRRRGWSSSSPATGATGRRRGARQPDRRRPRRRRSTTCATRGTTGCRGRSAGRTPAPRACADVRRRRASSCPIAATRPRRSPRPRCSRSSTAARSRPASASSDGGNLMIYKDLGMVSQVLDERRIPSLAGDLAVAHCRYSTTGSTVWENAQPTLRLGPRRALAIGHNGNLVNTRELLDQLDGRARPPRREHRHGAADRAPRRRAGRRHGRRPAAGAAAGPRRVQPRDPRRAAQVIGVRDPHGFRPLVLGRLPMPATAPTARRACGATTRPAGSSPRRPRRSTSSARSTCGTSSRARSSCSSRAASRLGALRESRRPRCACSSSSTSPARTRTWRAATCTRRGATWGCSWRCEHPVERRPRDAGARTPARRPRPGSPRRRASRTARAWSATATAAARSSSRRRRCASAAST